MKNANVVITKIIRVLDLDLDKTNFLFYFHFSHFSGERTIICPQFLNVKTTVNASLTKKIEQSVKPAASENVSWLVCQRVVRAMAVVRIGLKSIACCRNNNKRELIATVFFLQVVAVID